MSGHDVTTLAEKEYSGNLEAVYRTYESKQKGIEPKDRLKTWKALLQERAAAEKEEEAKAKKIAIAAVTKMASEAKERKEDTAAVKLKQDAKSNPSSKGDASSARKKAPDSSKKRKRDTDEGKDNGSASSKRDKRPRK